MRSEFDEWYNEAKKTNTDGFSSKDFYNAGKLSVQVEMVELQKQLIDQGQRFNEQSQRVKDLEYWNAELQKRVDAVLEIAKQGIRKQGGDYYLEKVEQALKKGG